MPLQSVKEASSEFQRSSTSAREGTMSVYVGAYMFELFLYGLYTALFSFWAYIVSLNRRSQIWPFATAVILMFMIATADVAVTLYYLFRYILNGKTAPDSRPKALFFITNNIFADLILLYRCYLGWAQRRIFLGVPCTFLVISTVCGYFFAHSRAAKFQKLYFVYMWMIFALNASLTLLIASKNIFSARRARSILGSDIIQRYPTFSATFMDSGIFYCLYLLTDLVARSLVLDAGLNQIVGLVPTLIIVRISLRPSVLDETIDTSSTPVLDSIFSTVGTDAQISPHTPRVEVGAQIPAQSSDRAEHA